MRNVLIIGATRGLGHSLTTHYAKKGITVYATARYSTPQVPMQHVTWIPNIDIAHEGAGRRIAAHWGSDGKADLVVICANYFASETFDHLNWEKEIAMYKTNSMGPIFLIKNLVDAGIVKQGSKIVLASSEKGSIGLRHESEGAADFGGHGSKAALNMVGRLLSIELKKKGCPVAIVHTGYLRKQNHEGFFEDSGDKHGKSLTMALVRNKADIGDL